MKEIKNIIIVSGLPGAGKSSIAEFLSRSLKIPVFTKDWIEASLQQIVELPENINHAPKHIREGGYEFMTMLAYRQLKLGQSVILEGVIQKNELRNRWIKMGNDLDAEVKIIECICGSEEIHKSRLNTRYRDIPNWHNVTWERVLAFKKVYDEWEVDRLVLDSVNPLEENQLKATNYVHTG